MPMPTYMALYQALWVMEVITRIFPNIHVKKTISTTAEITKIIRSASISKSKWKGLDNIKNALK
jgi:hypothetical protein